MNESLPIFYSFRRCPYAMRARLALLLAGIDYEVREIQLKAKPASMLALSPKGTVPVMRLTDGRVLEQSLDIMIWAIEQMHDADRILERQTSHHQEKQMLHWIELNDIKFKPLLDRYKYPNRHPEKTQFDYLEQAVELMLQPMDVVLKQQPFLGGMRFNLADLALFPFVRQFSKVDDQLWQELEIKGLKRWLNNWLDSPEFAQVMQKNPIWHESGAAT